MINVNPRRILSFFERTQCVCCGSKNLHTILERDFTDPLVFDFIETCYEGRVSKDQIHGNKYSIAKCGDCGFLFQKYILDDASMALHYDISSDAEYSLNKREKAPFEYFYSLCQSVAVIHDFFPNRNPRSIQVMDFGMGWGHWAIAANALGFTVKGCELSQQRINFARKNGVDIITDLVADQTKFDFINTDQVFEHVSAPYEIGKILVSKLKPGGILKFFVPNSNNAECKLFALNWKASKDELHPLEHINCFTWGSMLKLSHRLGLRPVQPKDFSSIKWKLRACKQLLYSKNTTWYFIKN